MTNIYSNLNYLIETTNISLDDLCELINIDSQEYILYYEKGIKNLSIVQLNLISDLFLIELESLMFEDLTIIEEKIIKKSLFGFTLSDLKSIVKFHKVIKNYIKIKNLC